MKKPVYKSRERILKRIDATHERQKRLLATVELMDRQAKEKIKAAADADTPEKTGQLLRQAQMFRDSERKATACLNKIPAKLAHLKRSLATFDTEVMAFMDGDRTTVEQ